MPKEVTIDDSSFQYMMQLWTEAPSTSRGPEVLEENSVFVREGTYKAAQPRARAETWDTIYFAVGFKSFDVSRISGTQGDLYE
ncbi:hypothetical protein H5410_026565 [Solanum commersonii]|uniref:Uncharacterized protein n=1 Tax=Solanum commersonii TaxID=4109 RepID=A0A9J5YWX2_SOLCO|nr:hypothetical protein H5410_026565 [Solanum commersonii]